MDPPPLDRLAAVTVHDDASGIEILIERVTRVRALKCPNAGLALSPREHSVRQLTVTPRVADAVTRRRTVWGPATVMDETDVESPLDRVAPRTVADADSTDASIASVAAIPRTNADGRAARNSIDVNEAIFMRSD